MSNLQCAYQRLTDATLALDLLARAVETLEVLPVEELPLTTRQTAKLLLRIDALAGKLEDLADETVALLPEPPPEPPDRPKLAREPSAA